jgi:hypothetical protein
MRLRVGLWCGAVLGLAAALAGCASEPGDPLAELAQRLVGDDLELRRAAAAQAAAMESLPDSLAAPLLTAAADRDLLVRLDAAEALGHADDLQLVPQLGRLAEGHPCPHTRARLIAASSAIIERNRARGLVAP